MAERCELTISGSSVAIFFRVSRWGGGGGGGGGRGGLYAVLYGN